MDLPTGPAADTFAENTYLAPRFGLIEFLRRIREDQLSTLVPELFDRSMIYNRLLFLHSFLINKPEYIEHVLLTNHENYSKSHFLRRMLGPVLGDGLLTSEGEFWRRQRRIAAPAFHNKRIADFVTASAATHRGRAGPIASVIRPLILVGISVTSLKLNPPALTI